LRDIFRKGVFMRKVDEYINLLSKRLTRRRFAHSLNVAQSACLLAEKYGADSEKAYTAGLLHDIMKDASGGEQLKIIEMSGHKLTEQELLSPKLWHAIAGAAFVKSELGIGDREIIEPIRWHTTGKAGMTLPEKIIFIADYISSDRSYNGIEKMRALAQVSLGDAMRFALEFTVACLANKGMPIHPDSIGCYNELAVNKIKKGTEKDDTERIDRNNR
jgi:predicted HD superfamily hydrolase involved in NAD metabolism